MSFDPYHRWLGIRDEERPPNHYKLLGVEPFEADPDVIATAADRQMAHVRRYQNGPHSALSQKLLNELAVAKLCLLDSKQRAAYDEHLRARTAHTRPRAPEQRTGAADDELQLASPTVTSIEDSQVIANRMRRQRPKPVLPWLIAAGLLCLLAIIPTARYLVREIPAELSGGLIDNNQPQPTKPLPSSNKDLAAPPAVVTHDNHSQPPAPPEPPDESTGTASTPKHASPNETVNAPTTKPPDETSAEARPAPPPADHEADDAVDDPPREPGPAANLILPPPPSDQELTQLQRQFDLAYAERIQEAITATTPEPAEKLAGDLFLKGVNSDNHAAKFLLLTNSLSLAIRSGNPGLANSAADQLATSFDVDPVTIRRQIAQRTADELSRESPSAPSRHASFVTAVAPMVRIALDRDDFDQAHDLIKLLSSSARKARSHSKAHQSHVEKIRSDWAARKKEFAQVETARAKLDQLVAEPTVTSASAGNTDVHTTGKQRHGTQLADAHWTIAHYEAFTKANVTAAAPHLVASGHSHLASVGTQEQMPPTAPEDQRHLGLLWLEFAEQPKLRGNLPMTKSARMTALKRAQFWLQQAAANLEGLAATETEQSLAGVMAAIEADQSEDGTVKRFFVFNGRTSHLSVPTFRYDGNSPLLIETEVRPASPTAGYGLAATVIGNATLNSGFSLTAKGGYWHFTFGTQSGKPLVLRAKQRIQADAWTRLVAAYDGSTISLQVNDAVPVTARAPIKHRASPFPLVIAANPNRPPKPPQDLFRGAIATLSIRTAANAPPEFDLARAEDAPTDASPSRHDVRAKDVEAR